MTSIRPTKDAHEVVTLSASAAQTASSTGETAMRLPASPKAITFQLDVTAAATTTGDTLDVTVQTMIDGTNWVDVVAFTQVLGDGGAKRHIAKLMANTAQAMFADAALAAGGVRHLLGDEYRVKWTIVDETTDDASFTFSVTAVPM